LQRYVRISTSKDNWPDSQVYAATNFIEREIQTDRCTYNTERERGGEGEGEGRGRGRDGGRKVHNFSLNDIFPLFPCTPSKNKNCPSKET